MLFAEAGCRVVGCDLKKDGAEETVELVKAAGGEMTSFAPVDLSSEEEATGWVDDAAAVYGGIDILYNNASSAWIGPFEDMTFKNWRTSIANELDIVFLATKAAWQHLVARGGGVVISTASTSGMRGTTFSGQAVHGAAKAGVINLTEHLAVSGGPHHIRAVSISPGLINTPGTKAGIDSPDAPLGAMLDAIPRHRFGEHEEIAAVARFLVSDEASFINGANVVDGGASISKP